MHFRASDSARIKATDKLDSDEAHASAEKMLQGAFTLEDFLGQLRQMRQLGPIQPRSVAECRPRRRGRPRAMPAGGSKLLSCQAAALNRRAPTWRRRKTVRTSWRLRARMASRQLLPSSRFLAMYFWAGG